MRTIFVFMILLLTVAIIALGVVSFLSLQPESTFEFSSGPCEEDSLARQPSEFSVEKRNGILEISTYVSINCAESITGGTYAIEDGDLVLSYSRTQCDPESCTRCTCAHELTYRIRGIGADDYPIRLVEQ